MRRAAPTGPDRSRTVRSRFARSSAGIATRLPIHRPPGAQQSPTLTTCLELGAFEALCPSNQLEALQSHLQLHVASESDLPLRCRRRGEHCSLTSDFSPRWVLVVERLYRALPFNTHRLIR